MFARNSLLLPLPQLIEICQDCGNTRISYNSCRNRHCPKCQSLAKEHWIDNQKYNLLNVGYFHVVFTIPDVLNTIAFQNQVVEYLGRYIHHVVIFNSRILKIENDTVSFKWRDYKDNSISKVMTLSAFEFIRRFLIHILPPRFMKIRHYGLLGNRNKNTKLKLCKILTNTPILLKQKSSTLQLIQKLTGKDISRCPCCGSSKLKSYTNFTNTS